MEELKLLIFGLVKVHASVHDVIHSVTFTADDTMRMFTRAKGTLAHS